MNKMVERNHQKKPITRVENLDGTLVLGICPNGGKTIITILGMEKYLKKNPKHKILILAHSTNVIRDNFIEGLTDCSSSITFTWSKDLSDNSQVHVALPANFDKITKKYDMVVVDEAHENYLTSRSSKGQVQQIIKKVGAKNQLLLTGTPSKFISEGGYDIEFISLLEMPLEYMSTLGIELIETRYNWKDKYMRTGNLREEAFSDKSETDKAIEQITMSIFNKIKGNLTAKQFNAIRTISKAQGHAKSIMAQLFNKTLKRTIFICGSIPQSNDVNEILNNNGVSSYVSHSEADDDDMFKRFKNNEFNVLVVVRRGRLGYSDNGLYNIIDMSGTHNPDLIYQMFARVLRGTPSQQKYYYKVTTQEPGMRSLTHMSTCAALMLTDMEFLSTFNGKNFNGIKIPVISTPRVSEPTPKKNSVKKEADKIQLPQFKNDIINFMKNVIADKDKAVSVYKMTTIAEVKRLLEINKNTPAVPSGYWNKERCIEEAKKYAKPYDLNSENRTVYQIMRDNKWMHEVWSNFIYRDAPDSITMDKVIELLELREFKQINKFAKKYPRPYFYIKNNEDIKSKYFPSRRVVANTTTKGSTFWTKEKCIEVAKLCSSRYDFEKKYKTAKVKMASQWPDLLNEIFPNPGKKTTWTKNKIIEVANNCSHREDMREKHQQAYTVMTKSYPDLADEIFGKKLSGKNRDNRLNFR